MSHIYKDIYLYFDEGPHKYTDSLGNEYTSVTTFIHNYVPKFDSKYWARKKAKEQGVSEKEILRQWAKITDEACSRGNRKHEGIETAIKDVSKFKDAIKYLKQTDGRCITVADIPDMLPTPLDVDKFIDATENKYPEIYRVFKHYTDKGYTIYSEIGVFDPNFLISGTIDILCYRPSDFVILDWKTNRQGLQFENGYFKKDKTIIPNQLTDEWVYKGEKMLPPLGHLEDCNGSHYSLQLSLYAVLTENILNIPCVGLGLCHIASPFILNSYGQPLRDKDGYHVDPNGKDVAKWHRINYLKKECNAILKDRLMFIQSQTPNTKQLNLFEDGTALFQR